MGLTWSGPARRFYKAIDTGDVQSLRSTLEIVLDACRAAAGSQQAFVDHINIPDKKGNSALALAARANKPANVALLLMRGADPLHSNGKQENAVHLAAGVGSAQCLSLLLTARPGTGRLTVAETVVASRHAVERAVDSPAADGLAPLHLACLHGHLPAAQVLLQQGAALDTPVLGAGHAWTRRAGGRPHCRRCAAAGASAAPGATPLHIAACAGDATMCLALLDAARRRGRSGSLAGDPRRTRDAAGLTPLVCALMAGHFGLARLLVQAGTSGPLGESSPLMPGADGSMTAVVRRGALGSGGSLALGTGSLGPAARARLAELLNRIQLLMALRAVAVAEARGAEWASRGERVCHPYALALLRVRWLAVATPASLARCAKALGANRSSLRDALIAFATLLSARGSEDDDDGDDDDIGCTCSDDGCFCGAATTAGDGDAREGGATMLGSATAMRWLSRLSGGTVPRRTRRRGRRSRRGGGLTRGMGPLDNASLALAASRGFAALGAGGRGGGLVGGGHHGRGAAGLGTGHGPDPATLSALLDYLMTRDPAPLLLPASGLAHAGGGCDVAPTPVGTASLLAALGTAAADVGEVAGAPPHHALTNAAIAPWDRDAAAAAHKVECSICMDAWADTRIPACAHTLCMACAARIIASSIDRPACPFCRADIDGLEAARDPPTVQPVGATA